ncbi:Hpt domain-containing protein, partial [Mariniphaga sediminis]|uniref:Hpt domain-containing protein n=1 Tax=Mariniphaga sediminis TaxID=1628158 RepID=UPI0035689EE8
SKQVSQKIKPDDLERIANGDPAFLREMILLFIKTSENGLSNIQDAVAQKNWEAVSEAAHKMAAPSKHLHAFGLYEKLKRLETEPQNSPNPEIIEELYRAVKKETDEVVASLKHYLDTHNAT